MYQGNTKLRPGDTVSVISPSSDCAGRFVHVFELGISRLREVFGLEVKEYPATRKLAASFKERAADIEAAFCDSQTKAVFAAIGGFDQMLVLKHVDWNLIKNNPKPFFGFSDNTSLHLMLFRLGIPSYYGGNVMNQFAWPPKMLPLTEKFARYAFFDSGPKRLECSGTFNEVDLPWADTAFSTSEKTYDTSPPWSWHGEGTVSGVLWGGCLEVLSNHLMAENGLPPAQLINGGVLALETSEELPSSFQCWSTLVALGERGFLQSLSAVLMGRPKGWFFNRQLSPDERRAYRSEIEERALHALRLYNSKAPMVFNVDFGHTEPQIILPFGRRCTVNSYERWIEVVY